jgi:hypothetical protein
MMPDDDLPPSDAADQADAAPPEFESAIAQAGRRSRAILEAGEANMAARRRGRTANRLTVPKVPVGRGGLAKREGVRRDGQARGRVRSAVHALVQALIAAETEWLEGSTGAPQQPSETGPSGETPLRLVPSVDDVAESDSGLRTPEPDDGEVVDR